MEQIVLRQPTSVVVKQPQIFPLLVEMCPTCGIEQGVAAHQIWAEEDIRNQGVRVKFRCQQCAAASAVHIAKIPAPIRMNIPMAIPKADGSIHPTGRTVGQAQTASLNTALTAILVCIGGALAALAYAVWEILGPTLTNLTTSY